MSGQAEKGNPTATEIIRLQRQAMKMLGLAVGALRRAHAKSDMLRLYNIIENETNPIIKKEFDGKIINIYKKYSLPDTQLPDGKNGTYNVQFTDRKFNEEDKRAIYLREKELEEKGKPERFNFINVEDLRNIPYLFYAIANSEQEKNSELDKALFTEQLNQGAAISKLTGRRLNGDKVIENFERTWGVDDMFMEEGQEMMNPEANPMLKQIDEQIGEMDTNQDNIAATLMRGNTAGNKQPSLNTLTQQ